MTTTTPIDLVVLDIAGTTIDEGETVYRVLLESVRDAGSRADQRDVQRWMGADKREAIRALLRVGSATEPDPVASEAAFADFRTRLSAAYRAVPPQPFAGVPQALATLRRHGVAVALTTGFDRSIAEPLLAAAGWTVGDPIDALVCADEVAAGRPRPYLIQRAMERTGAQNVSRVLAAGDTVLDLEAGTNAGAGYVIGVLTGAGKLADLGRVRHTHLLPGVADLPDLLGLN